MIKYVNYDNTCNIERQGARIRDFLILREANPNEFENITNIIVDLCGNIDVD